MKSKDKEGPGTLSRCWPPLAGFRRGVKSVLCLLGKSRRLESFASPGDLQESKEEPPSHGCPRPVLSLPSDAAETLKTPKTLETDIEPPGWQCRVGKGVVVATGFFSVNYEFYRRGFERRAQQRGVSAGQSARVGGLFFVESLASPAAVETQEKAEVQRA